MRGSKEIPKATFSTSAPTTSHKRAMLLIYDIFIAKKLFEAYLIISAFSKLVIITGIFLWANGDAKLLISILAASESAPKINLDGEIISWIADP